MSLLPRRTSCLAAVVILVGVTWTSPANAALFEATWNHHLNAGEVPDPNPTAFWDCNFVGAGGLICAWLWDSGLEISSNTELPMYSDVFYDAYGSQLPIESFLPDTGLLRIVPECRDGLDPCFSTFTPLSMVADAFTTHSDAAAGVFVTSSRGGLVTTFDGLATFAGAEWTDIAWMEVGLFYPDACDDPESGLDCGGGEQGLTVERVRFEADVPEPASTLLLGTGLVALMRRRRARASS